jgi:hypothetical protein
VLLDWISLHLGSDIVECCDTPGDSVPSVLSSPGIYELRGAFFLLGGGATHSFISSLQLVQDVPWFSASQRTFRL